VRIHHLALAPEWEAARAAGEPYRRSTLGVSLDEQGFVHCSFPEQVRATADRFYTGRHDVVLLVLDPDRLTSPLVVEPSAGPGTEEFPLDLEAVVDVVPAPPGPGGHLTLPTDLT
jgi:glutathione S-transferase